MRRIADASPGARLSRPMQSAAAEALLGDLRGRTGSSFGPWSKAHSRTLAAAVLAPEGRVGIDIEYRQPGRDMLSIAEWLAGPGVRDEVSSYRLFAFREAYFKALGSMPSRSLMLEVAASTAPHFRPMPDLGVLHRVLDGDFELAVVWTGRGLPRRIDV